MKSELENKQDSFTMDDLHKRIAEILDKHSSGELLVKMTEWKNKR